MHTKITNALKISTLALVLSFGLSYVYAWTAPTLNPPAGNVSAPINTSATSQTKAGDIAINGGSFLDTGTTIPETPASGTSGAAAVAGNGWPNFSDVAANAMRLNGYTSGDILSAQMASAGGGMSQYVAYGNTTCATGWTTAYTGVMLTIFNGSGVDIQGTQQSVNVADHLLCVGTDRTAYNSSLNGIDYNTTRGYFSVGKYQVTGSPSLSCAVCVR